MGSLVSHGSDGRVKLVGRGCYSRGVAKTKAECDEGMRAFIKIVLRHAPAGVVEEDLVRLLEWREQVRIDAALLRNVEDGKVIAVPPAEPGGEWLFRAP